MKLRSGDLVQVIAGKDVGTRAKIARVFPTENRIIVEGVAPAKRSQRQTGSTMKGGIIDRGMPVNASNAMSVCTECGPTKIGYRIDDDGSKHRICRKCDGELE